MANKQDLLQEYYGRYMTGYTMSKAILEDYAEVVAKLEGTTVETVKERVEKRSQDIHAEVQTILKKMSEELDR